MSLLKINSRTTMESTVKWVKQQHSLYIAPANPSGRSLRNKLTSGGIAVAGFVDNLKQGPEVYNPKDIKNDSSSILIAEGSFQRRVADGLIDSGIASSRIFLAQTTMHLPPKAYYRSYWTTLKNYANSVFTALLLTACKGIRAVVPRKHQMTVIYYAEGFADTNVLLTYRYHRHLFSSEPKLFVRNCQQEIRELTSDTCYIVNESPSVLDLLFAKALVVDHEYTSPYFTFVRTVLPVIQLWHGLPYKALSGNKHYETVKDHTFVSSSAWFNQHIFKNLFSAKFFRCIGYPRNDAFFQSPTERDWCNSEPADKLRQITQDTGDIIVYAPTYRDNGDNDYPIDLVALQKWCETHHKTLILKFHPFISRVFSRAHNLEEGIEIMPLPGYPNIYLYPSGKNIYPWLAEATLLVTDYSSIAYDFMFTGRPIVYFQYDREQYLESRGATLVPTSQFAPDNIVNDTNNLLSSLSFALTTKAKLAFFKRSRALLDEFSVEYSVATPKLIDYIRALTQNRDSQ